MGRLAYSPNRLQNDLPKVGAVIEKNLTDQVDTIRYLALTTCASVCATSASSQEVKGIAPDQSVVYKTIGETKLMLHIFDSKEHRQSDNRPAIVFFFGGGWNGGDPSQ
jgi:carboxylesterase type B